MSVYSLTLPTLMLLINIAQLGIPTTISKLIAKRKYSTFKIMQVSLLILLTLDLIIGVIYILLVPSIAQIYLKNDHTKLTLYVMVLLLPLISLTSLLKGYFIGIDQVHKTSKCQISEEIARLFFIILFVDLISKENISLLSCFAMFSTIIGEVASLIHMFLSLNTKKKNILKKVNINNENNKTISKVILKISLLNTSTRLIGSIIYFLEPIIYTTLMLKANVSSDELTLQYGIINSYVFPLLLLPSFVSNCISTFILPKLSFTIEKRNYKKSLKTFILSISFSYFIGLFFILIIYLFPSFFLRLLYGKVIGVDFIRRYAFLISLYYLQTPIHMAIICFDQEKLLLVESIICNILRILLFFLLIPLYKIDGLIISIISSIILSIIIHLFTLFKAFDKLKEKSKLIIK